MDEDSSRGRSGGFRPLLKALQRARSEVGTAVGHGIDGFQQWAARRWLPIRLALVGAFGWATSRVFEWLFDRVVEFGSWVGSRLMRAVVQSAFSTQILLLFFGIYLIHSLGQTKLIWDGRAILSNMTTGDRSDVRADGGDHEKLWLPGGAIGGIIIGATIGWSFGMDGMFVGASVGWVLGDEFDKWFDEKFLGPVHTSQDGEHPIDER